LVYEGALPVGTVICNGADLGGGTYSVIAETIGVNPDWPNVTSDISLSYRVNSTGLKQTFTKDELMKGVTVGGPERKLTFYLRSNPAKILISAHDAWGPAFYSATLV